MPKSSPHSRRMRRKAGERIRNGKPVETDEPQIQERMSRLRGGWINGEGDFSRIQIKSCPRFPRSAETWEIDGAQLRSSQLKRSQVPKELPQLVNVDFARLPGLPFTQNHRIAMHGVFSELLYRREDQTTFATLLLGAIPFGSQDIEGQLERAYQRFWEAFKGAVDSMGDGVVHVQGFTEVALHPLGSGGASSYIQSQIAASNITVSEGQLFAVPHVHLLLTGFDGKGVLPTAFYSKLFSSRFPLPNQTRFENIGLRKKNVRNDGNVSEHARRIISYAKKEGERSDEQKALDCYVQRYLPNNGWFETVLGHNQPLTEHSAKVFSSRRDFILNERMPKGFIGFDDNLDELTNWSGQNDQLFSDEAVSLVRNSVTLEAALHVDLDVEMPIKPLLNWGDIRCKICLGDECSCLSDDIHLFKRIQLNGYADPWYDGSIFERQREIGNFMSRAQQEAFSTNNGTFWLPRQQHLLFL